MHFLILLIKPLFFPDIALALSEHTEIHLFQPNFSFFVVSVNTSNRPYPTAWPGLYLQKSIFSII